MDGQIVGRNSANTDYFIGPESLQNCRNSFSRKKEKQQIKNCE
jgi:hypothetical protein